jgi:hypothetical protein
MKTKIKYLLVLVLASFVFAGCCTMHKTAQWEYKSETLYLKANLDPDALNKAATDGWQFVSATAIPNDPNQGAVVVFKRLKH